MTKGEKFNVADLSHLRAFWGNNFAHVILTAEADSLSTDAKQFLQDYGMVGCHSSRSNDLSVHARTDSTGYVRILWESSDEDDKNTHAAIFEVKFGKKAEEAITDSRERTADTLSTDLESVALAIEGSNLNITEDNFVPTAKCIQDTKERQLMTRSGLQRQRCRVCHIHHEQAMKAPYRGFWFSCFSSSMLLCAPSALVVAFLLENNLGISEQRNCAREDASAESPTSDGPFSS